MLMPIVSMNKMAMNESVAATCCFQEVASPTNVYWEVLNGGWIGSGFVETKNWKKPVLKDWAKCYGHDVKLNGELPLRDVSCCNDVITVTLTLADVAAAGANPAGWAFPVFGLATAVPPSPATPTKYEVNFFNLVAAGLASIGDKCDHNTTDCKYLDFEIQHLSNRHWEAVRAHGGISDWAKPHEAVRFHS